MSFRKRNVRTSNTRATQRDRVHRPIVSPPTEKVEKLLSDVILPATLAQAAHFHYLKLRDRTLNLPIMVAYVLSLIWRQVGSLSETTKLLEREGFLWTSTLKVTHRAVTERLRTLPADLFERILDEVLPQMQKRWEMKTPVLNRSLEWGLKRFPAVVAVDGSTMDNVLHKLKMQRDVTEPILGGRIFGLLDLASRLPRKIIYEEDSKASDQKFWDDLIANVKAGWLVIMDMGFTDYARYDELSEKGIHFITRPKTNMIHRIVETYEDKDERRDLLVEVGGAKRCKQILRLIEFKHKNIWYRYLTNVVCPRILPAEYVVGLYWQRWRIEDSFNLVKRLLGLAYFYGCSVNAIKLQIWTTWLLYCVLIDLTGSVAEQLHMPFEALSVEMVYRGLYHYSSANSRGESDDPLKYLTENAVSLGIVMAKRPGRETSFGKSCAWKVLSSAAP